MTELQMISENKRLFLFAVSVFAVLTVGTAISRPVIAASTSDTSIMPRDSASSSNNNQATFLGPNVNHQDNNNDNQKLSTTGSTEQSTNDTVAKTLVITAIPDKETVSPGSAETIHVKAMMENGTGISDVAIRGMIIDYVTAKERVLLGGQTDKKGELDLTATIGPHAKPGQFLAVVNASKGDIEKTISTGFTVADKGGSSDSKGRCSGSSCK